MNSESRRGFFRFTTTLIIAVAIAAIAFLQIIQLRKIGSLQKQTAALEENIAGIKQKTDAALAAVISEETLASAAASVYLIVVDGAPKGTAFVIDRNKGVLATAAHVAESLPLDDVNAEIYLLNRANEKRFAVLDRRSHLGFGAFRKIVEDYQPIRKNSPAFAPQVTALRDLAFDAALLTVDPFDSQTGENALGPDLTIAPEQKLLSLTAGAPIAIIGYPYDTLDDGFSSEAAISRVERGIVAAMTPPLDNAAAPQDPAVANLIIHRLSTAGGNSGSPVINAAGEVVGIHTHGIESASSNADGAAQRADVIYDLLDHEREQQRLDDIFAPAWRAMLSYWARAETALPWSYYIEYAEPDKKRRPLISEIDFEAAPPFATSIRRLEFDPASESRNVSADDIGPDDHGKVSSFVIREKGEYAETAFRIDRSKETVLFAFDYSLRSKQGFCPLTGYWRKRGDAQLRVLRAQASFELHLPAIPSGGEEDYQVIIKRAAGCDPRSAEFSAGAVVWPPAPQAGESLAFNPLDTKVPEHQSASVLNIPWKAFSALKAKGEVCPEGFPLAARLCRQPEVIELEISEKAPHKGELPEDFPHIGE